MSTINLLAELSISVRIILVLVVLVLAVLGAGLTISIDSDEIPVLVEAVGDTEPLNPDTDNDGLNDSLEKRGNTDPLDSDTDQDGLSDFLEVKILDTLANKTDTDGDGLDDGSEYNKYDSSPLKFNTDSDSLSDYDEIKTYATDPRSPDTDGDGLNDSYEVLESSTDPLVKDSDSDGLSDSIEVNNLYTDPNIADTDKDQIEDNLEVNNYGTDPTKKDTDGDSLTDYEEINNYNSDPTSLDTDEDGLDDGEEISNNTDPTVADTDSDGLKDYAEIKNETDPNIADTDSDGLDDGIEVNVYGSDPNSEYSIKNGLNDSEQLSYNLNPTEDPYVDEIDDNIEGISLQNFDFNSRFGVDSDGDGFINSYEQQNENFDPNTKDVVVEIAWTSGNEPTVSSLLNIIDSYSESPVDNGRGINVNFHILGEVNAPQNINGEQFYDFYRGRYDDGTGRHYALFTDEVTSDGEELGGISIYRIPGLVVSSGDSDRQNGRTLMHEMGHSLGLLPENYVGIDSQKRSMNQYPSVMNYESGQPCFSDISKCYIYSNGSGYNDWDNIEQNIESGSVTPDGEYNP